MKAGAVAASSGPGSGSQLVSSSTGKVSQLASWLASVELISLGLDLESRAKPARVCESRT